METAIWKQSSGNKKKKALKTFALSLFAFAGAFNTVSANNLDITSVSTPDDEHVEFTISWDHSWYIAGTNWDAVWIFIKAQDCGGTGTWDHVDLSADTADHSATGGLYIETASDGKGVFIRLNADDFGTQTGTVTLKLASPYTGYATMNWQVYGIEMVWVPQGNFTVGDGSSNNTTQSTASFGTNNTHTPYTISSEAAIPQDRLRNDKSGDGAITVHPAIPAAFPKGYNGFYCMKYDISQQAYVAFLNTLTLTQQGSRTAVAPTSAAGTLAMTTAGNQNRNSIVIDSPSTAGAPAVYNNDLNGDSIYGDGGDLACNYLSFDDLKAYLDWTALRPMTELEYEKACRGSIGSVLTEFPWGNTTILQAISNSLVNEGTSSEVSTAVGTGLDAYGAGASTALGPLRCGFAATNSTVRTGAGSSYWGIMDMGGNVWEQTISCGFYTGGVRTPTTLTFDGELGDGTLDGTGNCNVTSWPSTATAGTVIVRGGNWEYPSQQSQVSDRKYVSSNAENTSRVRRTGGRGIR